MTLRLIHCPLFITRRRCSVKSDNKGVRFCYGNTFKRTVFIFFCNISYKCSTLTLNVKNKSVCRIIYTRHHCRENLSHRIVLFFSL